jgi:hypothetical protein
MPPITIGLIIALVVLLLAIIGLVGVLPSSPLIIFGLIGCLALARLL